MKKLLPGLGLMLSLILTGQAAAFDSSLNLAGGVGNQDSATIDLYLKQTYSPWWSGERMELRPFTTQGLTYWFHNSRSEEVAGVLLSFGLQLSYAGDYFQPYVSVNAGPSLVSERRFVDRDLGGHFLFNTRAMLGVRFGQEYRHNLGFHATHYSNAHLNDENDGFNTLGLSYGYTF